MVILNIYLQTVKNSIYMDMHIMITAVAKESHGIKIIKMGGGDGIMFSSYFKIFLFHLILLLSIIEEEKSFSPTVKLHYCFSH